MNIAVEERVRSYELTYLIPATYTDSELTKMVEGLESKLKKAGAKIVSSDKWGKKKLAYKIKQAGKIFTEAVYFHTVLEANSKDVMAIEKVVYLTPQVLRHLLVVAEPAKKQSVKTSGKSAEATQG